MKIHIVNADNPVITGRDPGWYFLIFRPNRYEIKKIREPYGSVSVNVRDPPSQHVRVRNLVFGMSSHAFVRGGNTERRMKMARRNHHANRHGARYPAPTI